MWWTQIGLSRPAGCIPWWTRAAAGQTQCPKDCEVSGFKEGYDLGRAFLPFP
jgi:hypothetical protein